MASLLCLSATYFLETSCVTSFWSGMYGQRYFSPGKKKKKISFLLCPNGSLLPSTPLSHKFFNLNVFYWSVFHLLILCPNTNNFINCINDLGYNVLVLKFPCDVFRIDKNTLLKFSILPSIFIL